MRKETIFLGSRYVRVFVVSVGSYVMRAFGLIILLFVVNGLSGSARAQNGLCPPNLDFEEGSFNHWECVTGEVVESAGVNTVSLSTTGQNPQRHRIISQADNTVDVFGQFPTLCPNGSGYSVKLGNESGGHQAEGLYYTYSIPASVQQFSIIYNYAIVLQDPNHTSSQQPRFRARIIDLSTNSEINCVSFDFTSSGALPGFKTSTAAANVVYKDWTPISVDLSSFAGKTIRLEFITSDCTFQEHFGYAYIDVNSNCSGTIAGTTYCEGDDSMKLVAPHGFAAYQWFSDESFSQSLSTGQALTLNPAPLPGQRFPLVVTPFPGFGCADTLLAVISTAPKPPGNAGADRVVCSKGTTQLGVGPSNGYAYNWLPVQLVQQPTVANPVVRLHLSGVTNFIVKTTNTATGCFSFDTVVLTPTFVDTASRIDGKLSFCPGETVNSTLSVLNPAVQPQWFNNGVAVGNLGVANINIPRPGSYFAQLTQGGCVDTTRIYTVTTSPLPKVSFEAEKEVQCVGKEVRFTNSSTIASQDNLAYTWVISNGTRLTTANASATFTTIGVYSIRLVASTPGNCSDSVQKTISIVQSCVPLMPGAFTPNGDGLNDLVRPNLVGVKTLKKFSIYNRYGNLIFSTSKEGAGWDGTYKGARLSSDVFIWTLEYISDKDTPVVEKGTIVLIK